MTKQEKAQIINEALSKSELAQRKQATAEITPDGRIQYKMLAQSNVGRDYFIRVSFAEIIGQMYGEDMRRIHKQFSSKPLKSYP